MFKKGKIMHVYIIYVYIYTHTYRYMDFPSGSAGKESTCNVGDLGSIPGLEISPGEGMAAHSILAWRIPWTVQFMGLQVTRKSDFHSIDI